MNTSSKSSTADKLPGLLILAGFLLLLTALPLGTVLTLRDHYKFHSDWPWAITLGVVMTIATALVGVLFTFLGECLAKRRRNTEERTTQDGF